MYIHIGNSQMLVSKNIIGIFDLERTTVSGDTRKYINQAAKRKEAVYCTEDFPRSFVVEFDRKTLSERVYISRLSCQTLKKRCKNKNGDKCFKEENLQ